MAVKFFKDENETKLERAMNDWIKANGYEIISITLGSQKLGLASYIVACVEYK